jgi:heme oxygenase
MSAMAELRSGTWDSHLRLEKRLDVKNRFTDSHAYRSHLEKMWGFCAALERRLGREAFAGALEDYDRRRKLPLLTRDLIALGAHADDVTELPYCDCVPEFHDPAGAFGCAYVLEGATLGGRSLLPLVQSRLGLSVARGAAFLASYGDEVDSMWSGFRAALEAWCVAPARRLRAVHAAIATFDSLDRWLCGSPP